MKRIEPARRETNARQVDNAGGMHGVFSWRCYGQGEGWKYTIPGYMHEDMQHHDTCITVDISEK